MNYYITIPIFSDNFVHPYDDKNNLSLLYVKNLQDNKTEILTFDHLDILKIDNYDFLKDATLLTLNRKYLLHIYPFKNVYDINLLNYYLYNKPLNFDDIRIPAIHFFNERFHDLEDVNRIIPIYKHLEYYDKVSEKIIEVWNNKDRVDWESYELYNNEAIFAFSSIERNGIKTHNLPNNKFYSNYNLYTTTGRPSNSYNGVNFAALNREQRKHICSFNDFLVEYDYDGYHVRLIGKLIDYSFPEGSVHDFLSNLYGVTREEGKKITFKYLYGGIPLSIANKSEFFNKTKKYTEQLWDEFNKKGYIETPIYKRRLLRTNYSNINQYKLLNYLLQAYETEQNIKKIIKLQGYLYNRKTSLILYTYDSFLIDFSKDDNNKILINIKNILEEGEFLTKIKIGYIYNKMVDITEKM